MRHKAPIVYEEEGRIKVKPGEPITRKLFLDPEPCCDCGNPNIFVCLNEKECVCRKCFDTRVERAKMLEELKKWAPS